MIAKLEFQLDDFDDRQAHLRCVKALDMAIVLSNLPDIKREFLREFTDNLHPNKATEEVELTVELLFNRIYRSMEDRGIDIGELIS